MTSTPQSTLTDRDCCYLSSSQNDTILKTTERLRSAKMNISPLFWLHQRSSISTIKVDSMLNGSLKLFQNGSRQFASSNALRQNSDKMCLLVCIMPSMIWHRYLIAKQATNVTLDSKPINGRLKSLAKQGTWGFYPQPSDRIQSLRQD